MSLILSGTDGLSDVDGSAATPAIRGTDANTGIFFPAADTIAFAEGGAEIARFDSSGNFGIGLSPFANSLSKSLDIVNGVGLFGSGNNTYLSANAYYDSAWKYKATDEAAFLGIESASFRFNIAASGTAGNAITFTEAMRLDASGRLGIANTSPSVNLEIGADTSTVRVLAVRYSSVPVYLSSSFDGTLGLSTLSSNNYNTSNGSSSWSSFSNAGYGSSAVQLAVGTGGADIRFLTAAAANTNPSERARIDSSGNLLVGTTSAGVSNSLSTTIETSGANTSRITVNHSSIAGSSNGSYFMQFGYGGTLSGGITQASTTTVGFYTGPSDRRLKNNIEDLDSSGEFIDALRPRKWTWIKSGEADSGFVADELQTVISCCVNGEADAVDEDGKPVYQMVDASPPEMIANIVAELKAIRKREKEQQALITSLTSRITELEAK